MKFLTKLSVGNKVLALLSVLLIIAISSCSKSGNVTPQNKKVADTVALARGTYQYAKVDGIQIWDGANWNTKVMVQCEIGTLLTLQSNFVLQVHSTCVDFSDGIFTVNGVAATATLLNPDGSDYLTGPIDHVDENSFRITDTSKNLRITFVKI